MNLTKEQLGKKYISFKMYQCPHYICIVLQNCFHHKIQTQSTIFVFSLSFSIVPSIIHYMFLLYAFIFEKKCIKTEKKNSMIDF